MPTGDEAVPPAESCLPPRIAALLARARENANTGRLEMGPAEWQAPIERYLDPGRFTRELEILRSLPHPVFMSSEIGRGSCHALELFGTPVVVTRDKTGAIRAFLNVCRHRGSRIVDPAKPCAALVCPYHGWTYGLDGALLHTPVPDAFPQLDRATSGLVPIPVEERHGLVWLWPRRTKGSELAPFLAPLDADLAWIDVDRHSVYARTERLVKASWKLLSEAFLEGYHVRHLHRDSVARMFMDTGIWEAAGSHVRNAVARRTLLEQPSHPDPRALITLTYHLFPCAFMVVLVDVIFQWTFLPVSPDETIWRFAMLAAKEPTSEAIDLEKTLRFNVDRVFAAEDLTNVELIQRGLRCEANEVLRFGRLEPQIQRFHEKLDALVDARV